MGTTPNRNTNAPLTVAGLIEVLRGFDGNLTVQVGDLYDNGYHATVTPEMVSVNDTSLLIFLE